MGNMARLTLLFLLIALASGCAKRTLVALVPDPDGSTGSISVSNRGGFVTLGAPYQASIIGDAKEQPAVPVYIGRKALEKIFAEALSIQPAPPFHFLLFFLKETEFANCSEKHLSDIVEVIRKRNSGYISVIGYTDTVRDPDWNMELSRRRATAVKDRLVKQGVGAEAIRTLYYGEQRLPVPSADGVRELKNRVVEVIVR